MLKTLAFAFALFLSFGTAKAVTLDFSLHTGGGNGSVIDTTGGTHDVFFLLAGSDSNTRSSVITQYTTTSGAEDLIVRGNYHYFSDDIYGAAFDPFGYVNNGVFTQISQSAPQFQMGNFFFIVEAGNTFGWYIDAVDDRLGAGAVIVGAIIQPVPPPAAAWLLLGAVGLMGAVRRRAGGRAIA